METITSLNPKTLWFLVVCLFCFVVLFVVVGFFFFVMFVCLSPCLLVCMSVRFLLVLFGLVLVWLGLIWLSLIWGVSLVFYYFDILQVYIRFAIINFGITSDFF